MPEPVLYFIEDYLAVIMFATLVVLLFSGYPVAFVIGGAGVLFGFIGYALDLFSLIEFFNIAVRIWGTAAENPVLVAVPMFIFMGTMLEKSGVADSLLYTLQVLLRRVPGGLAMSITLMGTILAATTGIIGASVVMMTLLALPTMLERGYDKRLATGTIAASGTLGILIPPSIMLVIMADMLRISVGHLFLGAIFPGLVLSGLYMVYILILSALRPAYAPPLPEDIGPRGAGELALMLLRSFVPPTILIFLVLGSIFLGWATPTEAAGVGAAGAILLTVLNGRMSLPLLSDVIQRSTLTTAMVFFIIMGATAFSYVFRSLGGDDVIVDLVEGSPLGSWGILFLLMAIIFALGFFFEWIEITLIMLPIMYPILGTLDFGDHVAANETVLWFAIIVAVNLQTSFLTPPFGFALFYMKGVAPQGVRIEDIYRGIVPFVGLQLLGLALVIAFPALALWLPRVMFN